MVPIFTKSSVEAKMDDNDIDIFKQVVEKRFNEHTKLNKKFETIFKLNDDEYQQYQPYLFSSIAIIEQKYFTKATLTDRFKLSYVELKNKIILKAYLEDILVLEISLTKSQFDAILEKYDIELTTQDVKDISKTYYLIYAGTFMKNEKEILTSKLTDLRLIKIAYK